MPSKNKKALRSYWSERGRVRYAKRRKLGLCVRSASHGPAAPGRTQCAACIEATQAQARVRYLRDNPDARANCCGFCGDEGHNIRRCPELAPTKKPAAKPRAETRGAA